MKSLLFSCFLLLSGWAAAQSMGLHPPEVDWQQLRADHVRVLFPAGYEAQARRAASLIDVLATAHQRSVGEQLYDFDLVLQTPNMTVNGYVGLAPFRSEYYVTPPQSFHSLSSTPWVDLLTLHEFRHVQQTSNERRGLTRFFGALQGQLGWAVFSNLATPNWFSEGDAVIMETALSSSGRGRTPAFSKDLRALLYANRIYPYAKARNGSFRDLVPDHYRYGYALLTYARERFGNDVWKPVLQEGAAYRSLFYPFSRALKRYTGFTTSELYYTTMADLEQAQDSVLSTVAPLVEGEPVGEAATEIRSYRFPFVDGRGRLLALRTSYNSLPALVEVGTPDRVLTQVGIQREPWLDGGQRLAVWTEYRQNPRFTNQNYSNLVVYELGSGRQRRLTTEGHYLSASLSPDERQLVGVWYDPLAESPELHLLDVATGAVTSRQAIPAANLAWPRFSPDGQAVYFFRQSVGGLSIAKWDMRSGAVTTVLQESAEPVDMLSVSPDGTLVYSSGRTGTDNVYRLDPAGGQPEQLTEVAIGAYYPTLRGDTLYYASPTPRGERLRRLVVGEQAIAPAPAAPSFFERPAAYAEEAIDLPAGVEVRDYPVRNFSDTFGGIKFHSWSFNGSYVNPGISADFANALNTFELSLDGLYNFNENRLGGGGTLTYGGLFPVITLQGLYRDRSTVAQETRTDSLRFFTQEFSQWSMGPTVSVPLQWVAGNQVTNLVPALGYQYYRVKDAGESRLPDHFGNLSAGLVVSSLKRTALRQVQSRRGATATVQYDRALAGTGLGERFLLRTAVYLPGAFPTHGLRFEFDYQQEQGENLYQYPDAFRYARGYAAPLNDRVYRVGVNYQLPLLYPDLGILGITYFKRVRLNAFYDYSRFTIDSFGGLEFDESSAGGQFYFDNTWLNSVDITLGVEVAYRLNPDIFSSDASDLQFRLLFSGGF